MLPNSTAGRMTFAFMPCRASRNPGGATEAQRHRGPLVIATRCFRTSSYAELRWATLCEWRGTSSTPLCLCGSLFLKAVSAAPAPAIVDRCASITNGCASIVNRSASIVNRSASIANRCASIANGCAVIAKRCTSLANAASAAMNRPPLKTRDARSRMREGSITLHEGGLKRDGFPSKLHVAGSKMRVARVKITRWHGSGNAGRRRER